MNRELWKKRTFSNKNPMSYPCLSCGISVLELKEKRVEITPNGKHMDYYNYNQGIEYIFNGFLQCKNSNCNEIISISGICHRNIEGKKELPDGRQVEDWFSTYSPKFFYPNLKLFSIQSEVSENVSKQLNLSFSHYFDDLSSCANRIRTAIEFILNDLKAPKSKKTKKGKIHKFRTLNERILHFEKRNKKISKLLLALKIIGNEGSHTGEVDVEDILDAYEIIEELIEITFNKKRKKISEIADEIVKKNKPRSSE